MKDCLPEENDAVYDSLAKQQFGIKCLVTKQKFKELYSNSVDHYIQSETYPSQHPSQQIMWMYVYLSSLP